MPEPGEITVLLSAARNGDSNAETQLMALVYGELRSVARRYMSGERKDHTLQPTALVHESWIRLIRGQQTPINDRIHFFAMAATVMRHVLVDYAKQRSAAKRPNAGLRVELKESAASGTPATEQLLILHEALKRLAEAEPRQAKLVELIYFGDLTQEQVAEHLGLDVRTVKRIWKDAKAWLKGQITDAAAPLTPDRWSRALQAAIAVEKLTPKEAGEQLLRVAAGDDKARRIVARAAEWDGPAGTDPDYKRGAALMRALDELRTTDLQQARAFELLDLNERPEEEAAGALGLAIGSLRRGAKSARAWLRAQLRAAGAA